MDSDESDDEVLDVPMSDELKTLYEKKSQIEENLKNLEKQIYALETNYLEDTQHVGNLLRGWDGYLSSRGSGALTQKRKQFKDSDRLFSLSSATSSKNVAAR
eukprot:TRINITY_DN2217_c0_g1_i1.p1 TRINITY_DN2217_c0_g1~~TRINITY_DN2217_c0_g1_i1.p1  ORF type:complete len:114 (-),score=37.17 TRINITY_DN2217_c0_g1_i1:110-415(-)